MRIARHTEYDESVIGKWRLKEGIDNSPGILVWCDASDVQEISLGLRPAFKGDASCSWDRFVAQ